MSHQPPERPERARARSVEPGADSGQRKILAGKGRPDKVGRARQVAGGELRDIADLKRCGPPVGGIGATFFSVEIIGEKAGPALAKASPRHAAAAEELIETQVRHAGRFASSVSVEEIGEKGRRSVPALTRAPIL